jgi:hypothetical protein
MRSHGITDFPDPTVGSNGLPDFSINAGEKSDLNPQSPQFQAAQKACQKDLPNLGLTTPAQKAAANTEALHYAECMRSGTDPDHQRHRHPRPELARVPASRQGLPKPGQRLR